jgi:hypothetical protein
VDLQDVVAAAPGVVAVAPAAAVEEVVVLAAVAAAVSVVASVCEDARFFHVVFFRVRITYNVPCFINCSDFKWTKAVQQR